MNWLRPSLASQVRALVTNREGPGGRRNFNVAVHVGDQRDVEINRSVVVAELGVAEIQWLEQVHGSDVVYVQEVNPGPLICDAVWTDKKGIGLAIMTADCVPVLLCDRKSRVVGAAHAGWQGVRSRVVSELVSQMPVAVQDLQAYIGPSISLESYEVGEDVWSQFPERFTRRHADAAKRYLDLPGLVRAELDALEVPDVQIAGECVYKNEAYYSHRASQNLGRVAGRFVSAIGLEV